MKGDFIDILDDDLTLFPSDNIQNEIEFYEKRIKIKPTDIEAIWALAKVYGDLGDYKKGLKYLKMLEKIKHNKGSVL